ncbi:hypothetical protein DYQ86_13400 [Acidobacteria bacterium AB60]|nr:hypothetical protein DYQ86_13400 [Acidobacteria bacterium AB60]
MQFPRTLLIPAFAIMVAAVPPGRAAASPAPLDSGFYGQEGRWEEPPGEYNEAQRRGFHDGIEGARHDRENGRRPDVDNREEYRDPHIEPPLREAYRAGFRRGYETAAAHLWGAPPPPPPPPPVYEERHDRDDWGMRGLASDAERRGYHEGAEAARRDFQFQRRPDPDDAPEFRNPPVPPELIGEFREGFMRGYEVARGQLVGEPNWQERGDPDRWQAPDRYSEMERRGFHDGVVGARHDFENHRRPNVLNREEYRDPHMAPDLAHEYREGFRHGYEMAAARLWGGM